MGERKTFPFQITIEPFSRFGQAPPGHYMASNCKKHFKSDGSELFQAGFPDTRNKKLIKAPGICPAATKVKQQPHFQEFKTYSTCFHII